MFGFEALRKTAGRITGTATEAGVNDVNAIGVENGSLGSDHNSYRLSINPLGPLHGTATAASQEGEAKATGVWNEGQVRLNGNNSRALGTATASTKQNGERTTAVGINSTGDGSSISFNASGTVEGRAKATGQDDVGAFGVIITNLKANNGSQRIIGTAKSTGVTTAEARAVSIGISDIDDDTLAGEDPSKAVTTSGVAEVGRVSLGAGDDLIQATSSVDIAAQDGDEIFFAGANALVVDGGTITQLEELLATIGKDLTNFTGSDVEQILDQLDTSSLDMGSGNDRIISGVKITAAQVGVGADEDLEIIADGIENAGNVKLGAGDDSVNLDVSVVSTIKGAKALAQGLDNSSVGILTGLKLGLTDNVTFDMGSGNDTLTSKAFASSVDDLSAADALGTQAIFIAGLGNDTLDLFAETSLTIEDASAREQQSSIANAIENRGKFFLDDPNSPKGGNDVVKAVAIAFGEGLQTRGEGIETREFFDAGAGNDLIIASGTAITSPTALAQNFTQASGLQTEQGVSGTFLLGAGDDQLIATGTAIGGSNLETLAFGVTQVNADKDGSASSGLFDAGAGADSIEGTATASGTANTQVEAHGLMFTNAFGGDGNDQFTGRAAATAGNLATSSGIRIGVSNDNVSINGVRLREPLLPDDKQATIEPGRFDAGAGDNIITGTGTAITTSDGVGVYFSDVNGILVDVQSTFATGAGNDTITGLARATDQGVGGGAFDFRALNALSADGIEVRGAFSTGAGNDIVTGTAAGQATNSFVVVDGIDIGLGSIQNGVPVVASVGLGEGNNQLLGTSAASASGAEASVITAGIQSVGTINAGSGDDSIVAESASFVTGGSLGIRGSRADGLQNGLDFAGSLRPAAINLDDGNDSIEAKASATSTDSDAFAAGISQVQGSMISMGGGDDLISAQAFAFSPKASEAFGIFGGTIDTGNGNDQVISSSNSGPLKGGLGLGGGVAINMGAGNDILLGFGEASVDGGTGIDILQFEFSRDDFDNAGGFMEIGNHGMSFSLGGVTLLAINFEIFQFADVSMSTQGLILA